MAMTARTQAVIEHIIRTLVEASVDTGVADATSAVNHLDDSAKSWPVNAFTDLIVEITAATGEGQIRKIASNTATSVVPVTNFDTAPDATSQYRIGFFGKMTGDIGSWGGTALTGRDISGDLQALTDISITGILKSIGDIAAAESLIARIGAIADTVVDAGATGSMSAKLRRATQGLEDLKTSIVLAAGSNVIGKVQDDFGGNVYSKTMTMTDDNATRFETTAKKLRDVVIIVKTHPMLLGETGVEVYPVAADETVGFTKVDISTLYFKNAGAGNNGVITILGVEE